MKGNATRAPARVLLFTILAGVSVIPAARSGPLTDALTGFFGERPARKPSSNEKFLPPDEAFLPPYPVFEPPDTLVLRWRAADGYYLYRDRFRFPRTEAPGQDREKDTAGNVSGICRAELGTPEIPRGILKDESGDLGPVEVFHDEVEIRLPVIFHPPPEIGPRAPPSRMIDLTITVGYQGCAEAGLCYQPITRELRVAIPQGCYPDDAP